MEVSSSFISRLIRHHLLKNGFVIPANALISQSPDFVNFETIKDGDKLPRISGPPLANLLDSYYFTKELVI